MCETKNVQFLHCHILTMTSRNSTIDCYRNFGCILPSSEQVPWSLSFCLHPMILLVCSVKSLHMYNSKILIFEHV